MYGVNPWMDLPSDMNIVGRRGIDIEDDDSGR